MNRSWTKLTAVSRRVQRHFREKASSFDALYGRGEERESKLQWLLRPGLFERREFALEVIASYKNPRILDIGCGSGRIGELALERGGGRYQGVDFSEPMLELAARRLSRFGDRVSLVRGDFFDVPLDGPFEVILALGLFDYLEEPQRFVRRMYDLCAGSVVASFPRWNWIKGPIRWLRYEVINDCPIFNYTERELALMFGAAGFSKVEVRHRRRRGFMVRALR